MQAHLNIVVGQTTQHSEVIIIGDGGKRVGVGQCGEKEQTVCVCTEKNIFSFCFIIFNFFLIILYFFWATSEAPRNGYLFGLSFFVLWLQLCFCKVWGKRMEKKMVSDGQISVTSGCQPRFIALLAISNNHFARRL